MVRFLLAHPVQACITIIYAVFQLLIRCLYSKVDTIVAEQIYIVPELSHRYQRIVFCRLNIFSVDIRIYSAITSEIFIKILIYS